MKKKLSGKCMSNSERIIGGLVMLSQYNPYNVMEVYIDENISCGAEKRLMGGHNYRML